MLGLSEIELFNEIASDIIDEIAALATDETFPDIIRIHSDID
jgi:hypothetical protein